LAEPVAPGWKLITSSAPLAMKVVLPEPPTSVLPRPLPRSWPVLKLVRYSS
jgi:hypothetical protein